MKAFFRYGMVVFILGCGRTEQDSTPTVDPLAEVKEIFATRAAAFDSVTVTETDSAYTYFILPTGEFEPGQSLFGAFRIEKRNILQGDINGDGLHDAVVKYSYTPHLENNTLIYYKILVQRGGKLEELGEIYGGGRCEGPILSAHEIKRGVIYFDGAEYAAGDPCCCPSVKKEYAFQLVEGRIKKLD